MFRGKRATAIAVGIVLLMGGPAWGALVSSGDLFLSPWDVPSADYERIVLDTLLAGDGTSYGDLTGNSWTWSLDDIESVGILPLLNPYTPGDPAGYLPGYDFQTRYLNGDYSDYYYRPNVHYFADLTDTGLTTTFDAPGIYYVAIDRAGTLYDQTFAVLVDAGMLPDNLDDGSRNSTNTGASVAIGGPESDIVIVSDPSGGDNVLDNAAENAEDDNGGAVTQAGSVQDAINAIIAHSGSAGEKIHVEIVAHGSPGHITIGDEGVGDRAGDVMTIEELQEQLDPYVDHLSIYACSFAGGEAGQEALQTLADSIGRASGFTTPVSVHRGWEWVPTGASTGYWEERGTWDLLLGGKLVDIIVPAPPAVWLGAMGLLAVLARRAGRRG